MSQLDFLTDCETDTASNNTAINEYSPDWHRGMHDSSNVSRAIAFLGSFGIKARPVSFDEAVELCLTKLKLVNGKAVQVPHYRIISVRHGLSGVRHYLDEVAEMGKRPRRIDDSKIQTDDGRFSTARGREAVCSGR